MHVCQQRNSITHEHGNIIVTRHTVCRLGQVAIVASSSLWTVEAALTGLDTGRLNGSHGDAPVFGKQFDISLPSARPCEFANRYCEVGFLVINRAINAKSVFDCDSDANRVV